ncbi:zinc finger protein 224-like isoform X2 [Corticium candelabrum]|uniref:zinc finger protein 224-like isoform X2 n=1 Tax=Corticium candelabrum TaxID=121492 RepID=UPI002E2550C2|nr:zinc finger protein 224-like isoform X2 [Corticium candelabrum]
MTGCDLSEFDWRASLSDILSESSRVIIDVAGVSSAETAESVSASSSDNLDAHVVDTLTSTLNGEDSQYGIETFTYEMNDNEGAELALPLPCLSQTSGCDDDLDLTSLDVLLPSVQELADAEECSDKLLIRNTEILYSQTDSGDATKRFKCNYDGCSSSFSTSYKLKRHSQSHTRLQSYHCVHDGCSKTFAMPYNLTAHIKEKHEGVERTRKHITRPASLHCQLPGCNKSFDRVSKLIEHSRTHSREKPFHCDVEGCGKSFCSASKLRRHSHVHSNERPFLCSYSGCGKSFRRLDHLRNHNHSHTGQ